MNSAIALGIKNLEIPDQAAGMQRALTLEALMGQNELGRMKLANAPRELAIAEAKAGMDARSSQLGIEGKQAELMSSLAASVAFAPPEQQAVIYPQMAAEWKRLGLPNSEKVPDQWSPEFMPHLQQIAARGQTADKLQESQNYRNLGTPGSPQGAPPVSPALSALTRTDPVSGAQIGIPNMAQPEGSPIAAALMKPQGPQTGTGWMGQGGVQPGTASGTVTGQSSFTAPTREVTAKQPAVSPDSLRAKAAEVRKQGTKVAFDYAKDLESQADKLDDRIGREAHQEEQIRVREEAMALRKSNQGNQSKVNASKLGDDFRQEQAVKDYRTVLPIITTARAAVKRNTAGADVNLVYAVSKIFDPPSVVRDQERVTVINSGGLPAFVQSALGYVIGRQRIPDNIRKQLLQEMESRAYAYEQAHGEIVKSYTDQAKRWGLDPRDIVRTYKIAPEPEVTSIVMGEGRRESDKPYGGGWKIEKVK